MGNEVLPGFCRTAYNKLMTSAIIYTRKMSAFFAFLGGIFYADEYSSYISYRHGARRNI